MTELMELEILLNCYTKEELARMYLLRLKDNDELREENKRLKKEIEIWST